VRFFTDSDVQALLTMEQAIRLVRQGFQDLASGRARNHTRKHLELPGANALHTMAAGNETYFGAKVYSVNARGGYHFAVLLFAADDGRLLGVFEAGALTRLRTGAASAVATDVLAPPDSETVAILGTGIQARAQLEGLIAVRPVRLALCWDPDSERRSRFAAECARDFRIQVIASETGESAVRAAGIIVTATNARTPVLETGWVRPGAHINAIGANYPATRELPDGILRKAALIATDSIGQALEESGDLISMGEEGRPKLVELSDLVAGKAARPASPQAVTIFKSNGIAIEDVVVAGYVYEAAEKKRPAYS
jgi:alanine dehydrogenase